MATFVNNLRLKEITTGDEDGTWGTSTNTNLELITDGFSYGTKQMSADANETFTMPDATADATRGFYLRITSAGSLTGTREVTLGPNTVSKVWMIENATTGGQSITIKQGSGAGVTILTTEKAMVITDGLGAGAAVVNANPTVAAGGLSYVAKTANYTASNLEGVLANTTGGAFTVPLPASPTVGDQVVIADSGNVFGTNNCIAGRNGSTIEGASSDLNLDINGVSVQFVYSGSTWEVYSQVGGNGGNAVTLAGTQTLTNKTISADNNTLSGIAASSFVLSNGSGNIDGSAAQKVIPAGVVVGTSDTQTLTNKTLTSAVLGGTTTTASGNLVVDPATQIVEVKGDGSSVEGQIKLNCHANTHGQTLKSQPHSANVTNTMLLPAGASSTLVSLVSTDTLTNKTIVDTVYALSGTALLATNGGVQTKTVSGNVTFTDSLVSGDAIVLQLEAGASYTVTWPTMTWVTSGGNVAPTLTAKDTLVFWKVSSVLYGAYTGSYV